MKYTGLEIKEKVLDKITIKEPKLTIAVDFDGTIVENSDWLHKTFTPIEIYAGNEYNLFIKTIDIIKYWKSVGHYLIMWTCRGENIYEHYPTSLSDAVKWCKLQGLEFDKINNDNPNYFRNTRKILFDYCIDDKCCDIENINNWNQNLWKINKLD